MNDWIDINDRFPVKDGDILLLVKTDIGPRVFSGFRGRCGDFFIYLPSLKFTKESGGKDIEFDIWQVIENDEHNRVTHWMALPEFPTKKPDFI